MHALIDNGVLETARCSFGDGVLWITGHADRDPSTMRTGAMLPEENALPGSEVTVAAFDRDRQRREGQDRPDMGRHVVWAFGIMDERRIAVADESRGELLEVAAGWGSAFSQTISEALV